MAKYKRKALWAAGSIRPRPLSSRGEGGAAVYFESAESEARYKGQL